MFLEIKVAGTRSRKKSVFRRKRPPTFNKKTVIPVLLLIAISVASVAILLWLSQPSSVDDTSSEDQLKPQSTGQVRISDGELLVNGQPFFVKGVAYSPTPIGYARYDFFRDSSIHNRDFPLLQEMGCNTIRTFAKVTNEEFLDAAHDHGIYVVMGFWVDPDKVSNPIYRESVITDFKQYVGLFKDHPAVLLWQVGSEVDFYLRPDEDKLRDWYTLLNEMAKAAYEVEGDEYHPVITSACETTYIGDPTVASDDSSMIYLDAWGVTSYRSSFGLLLSTYADRSSKPILMTEWGCDAWDMLENQENEETQAEWAAWLWDEIVESNVAIGGTVFAYSDEWWKGEGAHPGAHELVGYAHSGFPDGFMNEQWFGLMRVMDNGAGPDIVEPRTVYYTLQQKWA